MTTPLPPCLAAGTGPDPATARCDAVPGLCATQGNPEAGHDLVCNEEDIVLSADFLNHGEVFRRRCNEAAGTLFGLGDKCGDAVLALVLDDVLEELCALEGILTALETSHAFAAAKKYASENPGKKILIGNSGRGDKDMPTLTKYPARTRRHAGA